jgi:hypothetical protein
VSSTCLSITGMAVAQAHGCCPGPSRDPGSSFHGSGSGWRRGIAAGIRKLADPLLPCRTRSSRRDLDRRRWCRTPLRTNPAVRAISGRPTGLQFRLDLNRPDFLARRATYTGCRDIFAVGINCHMIRIEEYLQEAHYAAIGVLSIAVRKYTCSIDISLLKLSIEITAIQRVSNFTGHALCVWTFRFFRNQE